MRIAVIGSRGLTVDDLGLYLPDETTEIISGGARGVDTSAREYALSHGIRLTEFLPDYGRYGRSAPLRRNITIIDNADLVLAFWDGRSRGTRFVIDKCSEKGVPVRIYTPVSQEKQSQSRKKEGEKTYERRRQKQGLYMAGKEAPLVRSSVDVHDIFDVEGQAVCEKGTADDARIRGQALPHR